MTPQTAIAPPPRSAASKEADQTGIVVGATPAPPRRPINVAFVVHNFEMGGLERCIARLVNGLPEDQFRPVIVCMEKSGNAEQWLRRKNVAIHEIRRRPKNEFRAISRLADCLKGEQIDIAHSHNWATLLETSLARKWAGIPVHLHAQRGMFFHGRADAGWRQMIRRRLTRWSLRRASCVLAVADSVRHHIHSEFGQLKRPVVVIPNGVERPPFDETGLTSQNYRQQLEIPEDAVVIGTVARLVPVKNLELSIEALSLLVRSGQDVRLLLVGGGPEEKRLRDLASECGVSAKVHFVGQQSDVGNWLQAMDLYINVSHSEGMSQSILEAMSHGLPLVVTDVGENAILAGGDPGCGFVIPPGDKLALAERLSELVRDPQLRSDLARNALDRHSRNYAAESMIGRYVNLYQQLAAEAGIVRN